MQTKVEHDIRVFIAENFLFSDDYNALDAECSLLEADIINSMGILELVLFLETRFDIKVEDEEVIPENLDSIKAMLNYLHGKLSSVEFQKSA